jgi:ribosomal protein S18 acetylase RimI-like enzyme
MTELWRRAVQEVAPQRGGDLLASDLSLDDPVASLQADLANPDVLLAVGTIDDALVGLGTARRRKLGDTSVVVVDMVYVDPEGRQVGVGESLMRLIEEWAGINGCTGVDAPALPGNRAAKAFFEGLGYQARLLVMHHRFDEPR